MIYPLLALSMFLAGLSTDGSIYSSAFGAVIGVSWYCLHILAYTLIVVMIEYLLLMQAFKFYFLLLANIALYTIVCLFVLRETTSVDFERVIMILTPLYLTCSILKSKRLTTTNVS